MKWCFLTVSIVFFLLGVTGCNLGQVAPSKTGDEKSQTATANSAKQGEAAKSPAPSEPLKGKPKELIALQQLTTKPKPGIVGIWLPQVRDPQTNKILPWEPGKDGKQQPWVIIEFKKDGTFLITGWGPRGKITSSGKYKLEGSKITLITEIIEGQPAPASERAPKVGKLNKDGITLVDDAGVGWIKKK